MEEQKVLNVQTNQKIEIVESSLNKKMDNMHSQLQSSITRLSSQQQGFEKGKFPSQTQQNPKGVHEIGLGCNTPKYTLVVFDMFRVFCKPNLNVS